MPALTKSVVTDTKTFIVREVTIKESRTWWEGIAYPGYPVDVIDEFAITGISLTDLAMICSCDVSDFDQVTCNQLDAINDAAKELNPHIFRMRAMLAEACEQIVIKLSELCREVADQRAAEGEPK